MIVQVCDLAQIVCVDGVSEVVGQGSFKRVVDLDLDVVDGGLWVRGMEVFINTDGVGELDWGKGGEMGKD